MLEAVGSHFLHPHRTIYGHRSCTVELVYAEHGTWGFTFDDARERAYVALQKGVDLWVRVDYRPGQSLPPEWDQEAVERYVLFCQRVANDDIFGQARGLIAGNETNLKDENREMGHPMAPWWVARVVFGHQRPTHETDNVYQFVKSVNPSMQVLLPAVAPYSPEATGDQDYTPPDGRTLLSPWEKYQHEIARRSYENNWHADLGDIKTAVHTYGAVTYHGSYEPWVDVREGTYHAQFGVRWLDDCMDAFKAGQQKVYGSRWDPWIMISECNTYRPPSVPRDNYPQGWWVQVAAYVHFEVPNVMGLAAFVDQDFGGGWTSTAMTAGLGKLPLWDADHDHLLRNGW